MLLEKIASRKMFCKNVIKTDSAKSFNLVPVLTH